MHDHFVQVQQHHHMGQVYYDHTGSREKKKAPILSCPSSVSTAFVPPPHTRSVGMMHHKSSTISREHLTKVVKTCDASRGSESNNMSALVETDLLTQGCFYHPRQGRSSEDQAVSSPSPKRGRHQGRHPRSSAASVAHSAQPDETPQQRLFKTLWRSYETKFDTLLGSSNDSAFQAILDFFRAQSQLDEAPEISTAIVLTGINVPDHDAIFARLTQQLHELSPYIVTLKSFQCQNFAGVMKRLVQDLMFTDADAEGEGGGGGPASARPKRAKLARLPNYDFQVLQNWYSAARASLPSGRRRPLIIQLQDFEAFDTMSCQRHLKELPFLFVLGVASTPDVVPRHLPRAAMTCLNTKSFRLQHPDRLLNAAASVLISEETPLILGPRPLRELLDAFLFHTLSINSFRMQLKLAIHEHTARLGDDVVDRPLLDLALLPDFSAHLRSHLSPEKLAECLKELIQLVEARSNELEHLQPELQKPMQQLCEVFGQIISELLTADKPNEETQSAPMAAEAGDEVPSDAASRASVHDVLSGTAEPAPKPNLLKRSTLRSSLKGRPTAGTRVKHGVEAMFAALDHFMRPWHEADHTENSAITVSNSVTALSQEPLRSCLHEHLASAGPLLGLSSSSLAAKAASRALEAGADLSGLPDLSVVYLLYLESGKLINLRDWMTAFVAAVSPASDDAGQDNMSGDDDEPTETAQAAADSEAESERSIQLQVRFARAVGELEFMGLVKNTKRKADHMQRMTWGHI
ncbi:uncharacterized protein MONBRDRAFT_33414 [Monosiga brevicollis MX1]|uniref:Origin recognition complex subunit 3 n=1 Tax=Monosiga brevicollis TaxID=81824 RepID=A9V598_MONBE|nr:uncharacterized protein MONBRDRAFT_33414 [Monosiga brevicollis MX1]EDQ87339.1 predicted protein [Monosiga brevicollis MX1]|eukprot:XP_001747952.1 hypothetical protein [Monosiga brevicollis MX1]